MHRNRVTLEEANGRVLYVRCHTGKVPGPYSHAFAIEEKEPGTWEAKIAMEAMTLEQRRHFTEAVLARSDIYKIIWTRYVDGQVKQRETIFQPQKEK